jgi:hypothetical protein
MMNIQTFNTNSASQCNLVGHVHPSIWRVIEWCQKEEATVRTIIQQDAVGNPPVKRTQQRHVWLVET